MNFELLKNITILYVEDEHSLQEDICQNISPFVKEIITAKDGLDGLEVYKNNIEKIDMILTDILMPRMNGIEMVDEIRKINSSIPVVYSTAFSDNEYLKKTIEQSISGYIVKPIDIELLLKSIEKASVLVENERLRNTLADLNKNLEKKIQHKNKELILQNEKLYDQLHTDNLTSLKNRRSLLRDMKRAKDPLLMLIDIDSFKNINDLYGEHVGDLVIESVANILKSFVPELGFALYRIGADQFAIMKEMEFDEKACKDIVENIILKVNSKPLEIIFYDILIRVDVTIGVSAENLNLLESADMALKKAKSERLKYVIYNEKYSLDSEYKNDIKWTKIIENAIKNDGVHLFYQPILNKDKKIIKYEALIRIIEGNKIYSPFLFLDIAKKVKFYPELTKIVIKKAFAKAAELQTRININLSIEDVVDLSLVDFLKEQFVKNDVSRFITFELLESESIKDYKKVIAFINSMRDIGCKIAIDDFGSGYSNFAYLLKFKPEYLKIDGSIVKNIDKDENSFLIVKTINSFAHSLGMKTVAEFVHSKEVFEILKSIDVDHYQGFYFAEPQRDI